MGNLKRPFQIKHGIEANQPSLVQGEFYLCSDTGEVPIGNGAGHHSVGSVLKDIANAGADTDRFMVLDASGNVKIRTGAQVRSDIEGAASTHTHTIADVTSLQTTLDGKLAKSGGTMTGALTLSGAPTADLHAATKKYVDDNAGGGSVAHADLTGVTANQHHNEDHASRHASGGDDALTVTQGMMDTDSVGTAQLKLYSGSVYGAYYAGQDVTLPGGAYGHWPQIYSNYSNHRAYCGYNYSTGAGIQSMYAYGTTPVASIHLSTDSSSATYKAYASQYYHASSGEVFWVFALRDKASQDILAMYQAPDHPAYGNGGNPAILQHPFLSYDPEKHEILIMNPTHEFVEELKRGCLDSDGLRVRDLLDVMSDECVMDERDASKWPEVPVTVGVVDDVHPVKERRSRPIKKVAVRPLGSKMAMLRLK